MTAPVVVPVSVPEDEEAVLGAMLRAGVADRPDVIERVRATGLLPEHMTGTKRAQVLAAVYELTDQGVTPEPLAVAAHLGLDDDGRAFVVGLHELASAFSNAAFFAGKVVEAAIVRRHQRELLRALDAANEHVLRPVSVPDPAVASASWLTSAAVLLSEPDPGPPRFLVDRVIGAASVAAVQGSEKTGKTWLLLDTGVSVVTGEPLLGLDVPDPGPVIVVLEESGREALHRRLDMLARGRGISAERLREMHLAANLGVRLNDPDWQARLLSAALAIGPRAILLDPFVRLKGADVDESSQREIGPLLDYIVRLRDASGAAVVFVHHTGHEGTRLRGSSDLEAVWESKLTLRRDESKVTIRADHREAESGFTITYRLGFDATTRTVRLTRVEDPVSPPPPDEPSLADRVEEFVLRAVDPTTHEVVTGVSGRAEEIREVLKTDKRFSTASRRPGDQKRTVRWTAAPRLVPSSGTNRDQPGGRPSAVVGPEGGGSLLREPPAGTTRREALVPRPGRTRPALGRRGYIDYAVEACRSEDELAEALRAHAGAAESMGDTDEQERALAVLRERAPGKEGS